MPFERIKAGYAFVGALINQGNLFRKKHSFATSSKYMFDTVKLQPEIFLYHGVPYLQLVLRNPVCKLMLRNLYFV